MEQEKKKISEKIKVNKLTCNYILHVALCFWGVEVIGGIFVFGKAVPQHVSVEVFMGIACGILCVEIAILYLYLRRIKHDFLFYDESGDYICFFRRGFNIKKSYIPLSHIKYIIITQNVFQKRYELADVVISTGVTRHKFQSLNKNDADNIKDELGVLMSENAYKNK